MKKIGLFNRYGFVIFGALLTASLAAEAQGPAVTTDPTSKLPPNLLDIRYVDLRDGFALRPPAGSTLAWSRSDIPDQNASKASKASTLWNLTDWELLKLPESKEVVRFTHPTKNQELYLYLLVTRQKMTIEQMLQARKNYWQQFTNQVTLSESQAVTVSDMPAVNSTILWHPQKKNWRRIIRETVIQKEKNRYFLLALVTSLTTQDSESSDALLAEAISNDFVFFSESDFQRRRNQARKETQILLSEWSSLQIKEILQNKSWYRIVHQGREVGFHCVQEAIKVLPDKTHHIDVTYNDYVANARAFALYANMMGVRTAAPPGENVPNPSTGPVQFQANFQLSSKMDSENFTFKAIHLKNPRANLCEEGSWQQGTVLITPCPLKPTDTLEQNGERFLLNNKIEKIFLPRTGVEFLGRLIQRKTGQEYLFVRSFGHGLGFSSLRVAAQVKLNAKRLAPPDSTHSSKSPGPAQWIPAIYLVGHLNTQGPIVEYWLDENGRTLIQKANGISLIRSDFSTIRKQWSRQLKAMNLTNGNQN